MQIALKEENEKKGRNILKSMAKDYRIKWNKKKKKKDTATVTYRCDTR